MPIGNFFQNLGDSAYNTVNEMYDADQFSTSGDKLKPEDFGLRGSKPNHPMTRMAGQRLAGLGVGNAIAGAITDSIIQPAAESAIGAGINYMKNNPDAILAVRTAF